MLGESQASLFGTERESTGTQKASNNDSGPMQESTQRKTRQAFTEGPQTPAGWASAPQSGFSAHSNPTVPIVPAPTSLAGALQRPRGQAWAPYCLGDAWFPPTFIIFLSEHPQQPAEAGRQTTTPFPRLFPCRETGLVMHGCSSLCTCVC